MPRKTGKEFLWSNDEVKLLLNTTNEYKVKKAANGINWESVKSNYNDILELLKDALSDDEETQERDISSKDFLHNKDKITKQVLTSKLKVIRLKFCEAVDSGRSRHGRVVMIYYEQCEKVWGGSPATEQIEEGLETIDLVNNVDESINTPIVKQETQPNCLRYID